MAKLSLAAIVATSTVFTATAVHAGAPADPAEKVNRFSFGIHQTLDHYLLRPAAMAFKAVVPAPVRKGIANVLSNLGEPVVAVNDVLQGHFHAAGDSTTRLVVNSTVGVVGVFDVAKRLGVPYHSNGFAVTLGRAGVGPGPYLFIPLVGPTTVRDAFGAGVDIFTDPFRYIVPHQSQTVTVSETVVGGLNTRVNADADLQALMSDATDPYATLRSVYLQNQQSKIEGGEGAAVPALPDFDEGAAPPATQTPIAPPSSAAPTPEPAPSAAPPTTAQPTPEPSASSAPRP